VHRASRCSHVADLVHLGPEVRSQIRALRLTELREVIFQAVFYSSVETLNIANILESRRPVAMDKPLVLCLCLVEQATADIRIEVASHLVSIESGLKLWSFQELLAERSRFSVVGSFEIIMS
jgi:hypothetical protein